MTEFFLDFEIGVQINEFKSGRNIKESYCYPSKLRPNDCVYYGNMDFQRDLGLDSSAIFKMIIEIEEFYDIFLQDEPEGPPETVGQLIDTILRLTDGNKKT